MKNLRILYWIPNQSQLGANRFIYIGWRNAFLAEGHIFLSFSDEYQSWHKKIDDFKPDIILINNLIDLEVLGDFLNKIRKRGICVFLTVHMPYPNRWLKLIRDVDPADIYFGEREIDSMQDFCDLTGKAYSLIPNAADRMLHFPTMQDPKYSYDLVFLGSKRTQKSEQFKEILLKLKKDKKYNVGIFGPFWNYSDYLMASIEKISLRIGFKKLSSTINNHRITVPFDEENILYSSSKICLNFHEREADGSQPHHIVNMRTFKINACGGFQLSDHVKNMNNYFIENKEIVMGKDNNDFFKKIDYYIKNEHERKEIALRGLNRARLDHMYQNRVSQFINLFQKL